jgi:hypothetical protein
MQVYSGEEEASLITCNRCRRKIGLYPEGSPASGELAARICELEAARAGVVGIPGSRRWARRLVRTAEGYGIPIHRGLRGEVFEALRLLGRALLAEARGREREIRMVAAAAVQELEGYVSARRLRPGSIRWVKKVLVLCTWSDRVPWYVAKEVKAEIKWMGEELKKAKEHDK